MNLDDERQKLGAILKLFMLHNPDPYTTLQIIYSMAKHGFRKATYAKENLTPNEVNEMNIEAGKTLAIIMGHVSIHELHQIERGKQKELFNQIVKDFSREDQNPNTEGLS